MKRAILAVLVLYFAAIGVACGVGDEAARANMEVRTSITPFWPDTTITTVVSVHRDEVPGFQRLVINRKETDGPPRGRYFSAWVPLSEDFSLGQEVEILQVRYEWNGQGVTANFLTVRPKQP